MNKNATNLKIPNYSRVHWVSSDLCYDFFPEMGHLLPSFAGRRRRKKRSAISTSILELSLHSASYQSLFTPHGGRESHLFELVSTIFKRDGGQQKREEREGRKERKKKTGRTHQGELDFHIIYPTRKHMLWSTLSQTRALLGLHFVYKAKEVVSVVLCCCVSLVWPVSQVP